MGNARSRPAEVSHRLSIAATTAVTLVALLAIRRFVKADGDNFVKTISAALGRIEPLRLVVLTLLVKFLLKNADWILGINPPIPEHNYRLSFEFGTRLLIALDAGYFSAIHLRPFWLRDVVSFALSMYYLVFSAQALENTKRFRRTADVFALRYSWQKSTESSILRAITSVGVPAVQIVRTFTVERPKASAADAAPKPVEVMLFFDGKQDELDDCHELILHLHGGGFMSMSPRNHQDYLRVWAKQTRRPIVSVNYAKAPENKYPYAVDEVFDVYRTIVQSNGQIVGLNSSKPLRVIVTGDSAGGNLAVTATLRAIESKTRVPDGVMLTYPALNMNSGFWAPTIPGTDTAHELRLSSHIRYIEDRVIDASIVSASANAYLRPTDQPDRDMYVSPVLAPAELLRAFPPVYINTGNRDPLYDDTVLFAARLREAKASSDEVAVDVIDGFSHGYLHMLAVVPEVRRIIGRSGAWMTERFAALRSRSAEFIA